MQSGANQCVDKLSNTKKEITLYEILNIKTDATYKEIQDAWAKKTIDLNENKGKISPAKYDEDTAALNKAYSTLSDEDERREYNKKIGLESKDDSQGIWKEDPLVSYKKFLEYCGEEANVGVKWNQGVIQNFFPVLRGEAPPATPVPELKVHSYNGKFYPLKSVVNCPIKCSKITLRNLQDARIVCIFDEEIMERIIGINTWGTAPELLNQLRVAYRNIVPSEFSKATQLAGPMGYHEYLVDGSECKSATGLQLQLNPLTPIKITFENCQGFLVIRGITKEQANKIFDTKSNDKFIVTVVEPEPKPEPKPKPEPEPKSSVVKNSR